MIEPDLPPLTSKRGALPTLMYFQALKEPEVIWQPRFAVTHPYVERCWLPVIGPSATWCLRRLNEELDAHPRGTAFDLAALARELGLSDDLGHRAPLMRTLQRLCDYGLARTVDHDTFEVRQQLPPIGARSATRLTISVQRAHREMVAEAGNPFLSAALAYAERGWAVLPLGAEAKTPDGRLAPRGLYDASTDPARLTSWWARSPNANVGIRTGGALDVVDLDSPDAKRTLEALAPKPLRPGIVVATARGWHLWFGASGLPTRAGVMEHVDVRGAGGYVVAPPSQHPDGHIYRFVDQRNGELTIRLPRAHLAPAPAWLVQQLTSSRPAGIEPGQHAAPQVASPRIERGDRESYVRAALDAEVREVTNAPSGTRNDRLNRAAFSLGTLVGARVLGAEEVREYLLEAAAHVGLELHEARRTINSGLAAGEAHPRLEIEPARAPDRATRSEHDSVARSPGESAVDAVLARVRPRTTADATAPAPLVTPQRVIER